MEGEVRIARLYHHFVVIGVGLIVLSTPVMNRAQSPVPTAPGGSQADLSLRKSVNSREFRGQEVQGEERRIGPGDSLWRILVEEKGLSGKKFHSYLVVVRGLNPQVKNLDVLRVGDKLFIPLHADQLVEGRLPTDAAASSSGTQPHRLVTTDYRVKSGERLVQILREQLKLTDDRKIAEYYALVKDLNPERKNWDNLLEGEILRLPVFGRGQEMAAPAPPAVVESQQAPQALAEAESKAKLEVTDNTAPKAAATLQDRRQTLRGPAKDNMALLATVVEATGSHLQHSGEEAIVLNDGMVRLDKSSYPVVYNPALGQRVVIDVDDKIPASLRAKLGDPTVATQVLPVANGVSIQEAVSQLLARLGYQSLPTDRPVIVQEDGVAFEAQGNWIALAPEQNNRTQEVLVISLAETPSEIPDYLKSQLAKNGLHLRDVLLPLSTSDQSVPEAATPTQEVAAQVKNWPRDKREMVDSLLLSLGIPFGAAETVSLELRDGLRMDARIDRLFEQSGERTALFFQRADPEIKKVLQDKQGVRAVELDIASLSSRELITRVFQVLGNQASYREHRFPAGNGSAQDRLTITAWGFHLPARAMFVTDRQIPATLYRFFFEKGLEIVYFQ